MSFDVYFDTRENVKRSVISPAAATFMTAAESRVGEKLTETEELMVEYDGINKCPCLFSIY
jgi:hypothetical protein